MRSADGGGHWPFSSVKRFIRYELWRCGMAGSVVAAVSTQLGSCAGVVAGRVLQGLSGGVFPCAFGLARQSVAAERLGGVVAALSAMFGVGGAFGMVAAGPLVDVTGPATLFWLVAAPALAALTGMVRLPSPPAATLEEACAADAVIVGSGIATREVTEDPGIMNVLRGLDPSRQLVAAQCSGALVLARLGLLDAIPACTDLTTKPWVVAAGVEVLNQPFYAKKNLATAGGCLASHYLAARVIARLKGHDAAEGALHYVAPVGEKEEYVERAWRNITPYLPAAAPALV
ncbi:MFS transporter [Streptomyces sp. NPDC050400]|uniref:MFS transporter n=1 Tax=Streptomyces sp. NPDC050400 TaxID=3365610 RepID=UPI0037B827D4